MNPAEIRGSLEAIIYAADEPATVEQMAKAIGVEKHEVRPVLDELVASYAADERGVEIREVAGGFKFYTKAQFHDPVRRFIKGLQPPLRLTMSALETLAVIAYKQPATQPEIQEIRGVNSSGVLQTLLEKRLITTAGRKAVIGRPILYRTSRDFLMRFGLSDVGELPSLKEFEALARQALGADEGIAAVEPGDAEPGELAPAIAAEASGTEVAAAAETSPVEQAVEMAVNEPPMAEVAAPIAAAAAVGSAARTPASAENSSNPTSESPEVQPGADSQ